MHDTLEKRAALSAARGPSVRKQVFRRGMLTFLGFLSLLPSCKYYETRQILPDNRLPVLEKNIIILHRGVAAFQLAGARFANEELSGLIADVPRLAGAAKRYELHLLLSDEFPLAPAGTQTTIPIRMISSAWVYDLDLEKTVINTAALTSVLSTIGVFAGCSILAISTSCPCVYVEDGGQSRFVGEIFPGSLQPALERHDYLHLDGIRELEGEYRVRLVNELREIQHTNLAELVVYDHPLDTSVLVDQDGRPHTILEAQPPLQAVDSNGHQVLDELSRRDDRAAAPQSVPASGSGLYSLYLSFPRPPDARSVKIVLRARNSFWLDYCYFRFQALFGSAFPGWQARQKEATAEQLLGWKREQGIGLSVSVKSGQQWHYVDSFHEAGPLSVRDQVMVVDLQPYPARETLELKVEAGFLFWDVDFLGVDYSEDLRVSRTALSLLGAENQESRDVMPALRVDDEEYYDQPGIGDSATLRFPCPPLPQGLRRTVFLHAKGYYEVTRDFSGQPDLAALSGFRKPGAFPCYSRELFAEICE